MEPPLQVLEWSLSTIAHLTPLGRHDQVLLTGQYQYTASIDASVMRFRQREKSENFSEKCEKAYRPEYTREKEVKKSCMKASGDRNRTLQSDWLQAG
jgi:hypothetical protein